MPERKVAFVIIQILLLTSFLTLTFKARARDSTAAISNNGVSLSSVGSGADEIVHVSSPGYYMWSLRRGDDLDNNRKWNLTRYDLENEEQMFQKVDFLFYCNGSTQGSNSNDAVFTWSNTTFTDSLGSGILFNRTFTQAWLGSLYGVYTYEIWKFYPTFITCNVTVMNGRDSDVRRVTNPMLIYSDTYDLALGAGATIRWTGLATCSSSDMAASTTGAVRTPAFIYNTATDEGLVVDVIDHYWDWLFQNNAYQASSPSMQFILQGYVDDRDKEYIDLSQDESTSIGTLFFQATGHQIDDAYSTLGEVYTTLYPGRYSLPGFDSVYTTWSAYDAHVTWDDVKADVDYLAAHRESGIQVIQLDSGYQAEYGNWTTLHSDFTDTVTLEDVVDYITGAGFKCGLWVAPWCVGGWALDNATMRGWLVNGTVTGNFKQTSVIPRYDVCYHLDATNEDARAWITEQLDTLVSYGVTYFKLDMLHAQDLVQKAYTEKTRATWQEYFLNISEVFDKENIYVVGCFPDPYGAKQPYFAQNYFNAIRFSIDLTDIEWTTQVLPSYEDYHVIAPLFNHLTVKADMDMFGDDAIYGDKRTDNEWKFSLVYHGLGKMFEWSNNFSTGNATKLEWMKSFLPLTASSWIQRDYWDNNGVTRTWLTSSTLGGNMYYYVATLNPTDSQTTFTVDLTQNLDLPASYYLIYDNFADSYLGTEVSDFDVTLAARQAKIFTLLALPSSPTYFAWQERDHIATSQISDVNWANLVYSYSVASASGTTSTTYVYAAGYGSPIRVTGATSWSYDETNKLITIEATHSSAVAIFITFSARALYTVWTDSGVYYAKDSDGNLVISSTNASDVINWAMTAASRNGGGTVLLLRGTYYLKSTLFLQSSVHLQGESSKLTKITVADSTSEEGFLNYHDLVIAYNQEPIINAEISSLTLDPNSKGITFPLASFDARTQNYYLKVHDCNFPEGGLNSGAAISLEHSVSAEVYNNTMLNQMHGIYAIDTNYTNIHDNYLDTSSWEGFYFDDPCYYNVISGNTIRNASYLRPDEAEGLEMHGNCKYNTVKDNNFQFCINGIWDWGQFNIISNNHFNAVYNGVYIAPYDGVSGDIVTGNHIQNAAHVGIGIQDGSNVIVASNLIEGGSVYNEGLRAYNSSNVTFSANQVKSVYYGINLFHSMFCTVVGNEIATSVYGVYEGNGSDYNTVVSNNISENGCGIELDYSSSNKFYHNNFVNNGYQVSVRGKSYNNVWDNGYPSGGNHWSDYAVKYPSAQELDDSGIWDTPYVIDADNRDNYPLMNPYIMGDINYDGTVNAFDLSEFNRAYGAMPESSNWNVRADVDNNFIVNVVDLFQLSRNYGKTTT